MFYHWIDILGTASFAISGALTAMKKKLDIFGVIIISFVTAIGGGTIRDLLIGVRPVSWLTNISTSVIIFVAATFTVLFRVKLVRLSKSLFLFDTLGLGLFTILGLQKAAAIGIHPALCVGLGTVSACFGGVSRDILCNEIPVIFRKEIYATACIAGGILYFILLTIPRIDHDFVSMAAITLIIAIRMYAVIFKKSLPSIYK